MARAFGSVIPFGEELLVLSTVLFALATMIGWSCLGERTAVYLAKEKGTKIYKWLYVSRYSYCWIGLTVMTSQIYAPEIPKFPGNGSERSTS